MEIVNVKLIEIVNREKEDITNKDLVERLKDEKTGLKRGDLVIIESMERSVLLSKFFYNLDSTHINYWDALVKDASVHHIDITHKDLSDVNKLYKVELPGYILQ